MFTLPVTFPTKVVAVTTPALPNCILLPILTKSPNVPVVPVILPEILPANDVAVIIPALPNCILLPNFKLGTVISLLYVTPDSNQSYHQMQLSYHYY